MNSKILVTIIMIVSATLGLYIGINQVSSQKEGTKDVFNPNIETSGDFSSGDIAPISGDSGDIQPSGEDIKSGDAIVYRKQDYDLSNTNNNKENNNYKDFVFF